MGGYPVLQGCDCGEPQSTRGYMWIVQFPLLHMRLAWTWSDCTRSGRRRGWPLHSSRATLPAGVDYEDGRSNR